MFGGASYENYVLQCLVVWIVKQLFYRLRVFCKTDFRMASWKLGISVFDFL